MATRNAFGQTWWGEQWLNALTQIDFDNRLPRGRTYANNGSVKQIEIHQGKIAAKVKGSRPSPYKIVIEVPPMPEKQAGALLDALVQNPVLISRLLNRELAPEVLDLAHTLKIAVFPARWQDLKMSCSCPDWAVPCKHLAAVIYLVSREIDGNPFMVFSLRSLDLAKALKARDISIEQQASAALPGVSDLLAPDAAPAIAPPVAAATGSLASAVLDYTTIPDLGAILPSVLAANPAFFPHGDFRAVYEKIIKRIAKSARRELDAPLPPRSDQPLGPADKPMLLLNAHYQPSVLGLDASRQLFGALRQLNEAALPDLQPELAALYHARMLCLHLLAQGAILPQVFDAGAAGIGLRWLPAMLDANVRQLLQQLATLLPPDLLRFQAAGSKARPALPQTLPPAVQALTLCGVLLDQLVSFYSEIDSEKPAGNKVSGLFFGDLRSHFDGPGEGSIAHGVQAWLARFHLGQQAYAPLFWLDEQTGKEGFSLRLAVANPAQPLQPPTPFVELLSEPRWQAARYPVLQTVALLAGFFPPLNQYVSNGGKVPLTLSAETLPAFLFDTLPMMRLLGIQTVLPKALERILRPRLSMRISAQGPTDNGPGFLSMDDMFNFDWNVAIGGQQISAAEFEKLVTHAHGIVQFKGEYVFLDAKEIDALRAQLAKPPQPDAHELLRIALAEEYAGSPIRLDANARALIERITQERTVALPNALQAQLRPYQERGFAWLVRNLQAGFGSVIADDMGLGKTVQVIATLLKMKQDGELDQSRALVVVPTSLLTNWGRELARFAPQLSVAVFHGGKRELALFTPPSGADAVAGAASSAQAVDVLLTTYGTVRSDLAKLKKIAWRILIIDEAQNIKNPATAQTKALKALPAQAFIAMSGTPVENRLSEYWSIMDFANRGMLGTLGRFSKEFAQPIQTEHDQQVLARFKRITAPFLLRRLKSDKTIISDLPDKIEQDQFCSLSQSQSALYESVVREALRVIAGESNSFNRQGLVLQMITTLKQICNHPSHYLKQSGTGPELSGKTELFLDLLEAINDSHEKVLVFTQYREMGELLAGWIKQRFGREPQFLHGAVTRARRDEMVERFQNDRTERIFLLSLKAGGTGLNLTAASNVIHYDLWWNPAVEAQATDRAYRIGQQKNVQVHRLITRATFEERINDMIQSKRDLADLTVGTGESWIGNLSNAELADVFRLG